MSETNKSDEPLLIVAHHGSKRIDLSDETLVNKVKNVKVSSRSCSAYLFKGVQEWDDASLEIKWNSEQKEFTVAFKGEGQVNLPIENLLSQTVPLHIAESSNCECGETLQLGDYRILTSNNDFTFEGNFFCPTCKTKVLKERSGLRYLISTWFRGLKKLEIKTTGLGIERQ